MLLEEDTVDSEEVTVDPDDEQLVESLLKSRVFPRSFRPLMPFFKPMISEIAHEVKNIYDQGKARVAQKLAEDPSLDEAEEKAKMRLRVSKKIKQMHMERMPELLMKTMRNMSSDPSQLAALVAKMSDSKIIHDLRTMQSNPAPFVQKIAVEAAIQSGNPQRSAFLKQQYKSPESGESQLLQRDIKWFSSKLQPTTAEALRLYIREKTPHAVITETVHTEIINAAKKARTDDDDLVLAICDEDSNAYSCIAEQAEILEEQLDEMSVNQINAFMYDVTFKVHKALELDVPGCFQDVKPGKRVNANNRYFTKWSENEYAQHMQSSDHNLGLF